MKHTEGFVTDDGTFFENEQEAQLYEAEFRLRGFLSRVFPKLNQETFFEIVLTLKQELLEYLNAHSTANATEPDTSESEIGDEVKDSPAPEVDEHPAILSSAEEDLAAILKLPKRKVEGNSRVGGDVLGEQRGTDMVLPPEPST